MNIRYRFNQLKAKLTRKHRSSAKQQLPVTVVQRPTTAITPVVNIIQPNLIQQAQENEYQLGLAAYQAKNFAEALRHFEKAYENHHALYYMGKLYEKGIPGILEKDDNQAFLYYGNAASYGNDHAEYRIGKLHQNGTVTRPANIIEAIRHYEKATGSPRALCKLGDIYRHGLGDKNKNIETALNYYIRASDAGDIEAKYKLARLYAEGKENISQNQLQAKKLFEEVSQSQHKLFAPLAQLALGNYYQSGLGGFPKDINKAIDYYGQAVNNGLTAAYTCYAETLFLKNYNVAENVQLAYPYLMQAIQSSKLNELNAKSLLGLFYQMGWMHDQTSSADQATQAFTWHQKATEGKKNSFSFLCLGLLYAEGDVIAEGNPIYLAEKYFIKSEKASDEYEDSHAEEGHQKYEINNNDLLDYLEQFPANNPQDNVANKKIYTLLGILYERGLVNTNINIDKALICYQRAAQLGGIYARNKLLQLPATASPDQVRFLLIQERLSQHNANQMKLRKKLDKTKRNNFLQQHQIDKLQDNIQNKVESLHLEIDQIDQKAKQFVARSANLDLFHNIIRNRLEAILVSLKSAAGGFTKVEDGKIASVNTIVEMFGDIIGAIPLTAPGGALIKWGINKPLEKLDQTRQKNIVVNLSDRITLAESQKYAASFALRLTERFAQQINFLATPEQESKLLSQMSNIAGRFIKHTKDTITHSTVKSRHLAPAEKLAAFALIWCLDNLLTFADQNSMNQPALDEYLLRKMEDMPSNEVTSFWQSLIQYFHKKEKILGADGGWLDVCDLYTRPGIKTPCGICYESAISDYNKFGWREGNIIEIERKNLRFVGHMKPAQPNIITTAYNNNGLFGHANPSATPQKTAIINTHPTVTRLTA